MIQLEVVDDPRLLEAIHATILTPVFRPAELLPAAQLRQAVAAGACEVLVVPGVDGPQAVAVGEFADGVVLLVYLAVAPGVRSRGTGGKLLDAAVARWRVRPGVKLVVAEVDRPDFHTADAVQGDPSRRLEFYARHGGLAFDLPYFQPSVGPGQPPVHGMLLIALAADRAVLSADGGRLVRVGRLRDLLAAGLDQAGEADEAGRRLLARLDDPDGVQLLPLSGYAGIEPSAPRPTA